jgi:hypothetical protein
MMAIELIIWEVNVCFYFMKLNKIARCGLETQQFSWRYEIKF